MNTKAVLIGGPADMSVLDDVESHCVSITFAEKLDVGFNLGQRGLPEYDAPPLQLHVYKRLALTRGTVEFVGFYHACPNSACGHRPIDPDKLSRKTIHKAVEKLCDAITTAWRTQEETWHD